MVRIVDEVKAAYPGTWCTKYFWCGPDREAAASMESTLRSENGNPSADWV